MLTLKQVDHLNDIVHRLHQGEQIDNHELLTVIGDVAEAYGILHNQIVDARQGVSNVAG